MLDRSDEPLGESSLKRLSLLLEQLGLGWIVWSDLYRRFGSRHCFALSFTILAINAYGIFRSRRSSLAARSSSHLVTKSHHAALVGLDFHQMQRDVPVQLLEEGDPLANQDRQHRVSQFVREAETKTFGGDRPTSHEPDVPECGPQAVIHELREIA